jgi:hypothetical protein
MYTVIKDENEIKICCERFRSILSAGVDEEIACSAGFRGGKVDVVAFWSNHLRMWAAFRTTKKYWNAFGLERPQPHNTILITAEINFSYTGSADIQGAFIKNEKGEIYVGHRGRFGDVRHISRDEFLRNTQFPVITVNKDSRLVLVGELEASGFSTRVRDFIQEVSEMKETV